MPKVDLSAVWMISLSFGIYLAANYALNHGGEAVRTFWIAVAVGFVALAPLGWTTVGRLLGTPRFLAALACVYIFKIGVGVGHYLAFIQPDYFAGNIEFNYTWDYMWLDQSMQFVAESWNSNGLFSPLGDEYWQYTKNGGLLAFMGLNYYAAGSYPLNISTWNTLFGVYSAILVMEIAMALRLPMVHLSLVCWVMLLLPFNLITSTQWRDTTGQALIFLGVYLIVKTRSRMRWWIFTLPAAGLLAYQQREPYLFVIFSGAIIWLANEYRRNRYMPVLVGFGILLAAVWVPVAQRISTFALVRYTNPEDGISAVSFFARGIGLPARVFRGIVGPFPWTQYMQQVTGYEYQPADYLQHVLNLAILSCALPLAWKLYRAENRLDFGVILGLGLFVIGAVATGVHSSYVSIGIPLLLPMAARAGRHEFLKRLGLSLLIFLGANFCYVAMGLQGSGFFQSISGGY